MDRRKPDIGGIPRQSLIYIGLCLAGILIFVLAGILPASVAIEEIDAQTAVARFRLEEQKMLAPYYQRLLAMEGQKGSALLPLPERGRLPQAKINTLPLSLGQAAKMSGMTLVSAVPNLKDLVGDAQVLPVTVILKGSFSDFRKFLIQLGGMPFVERIEEISIQERIGARIYRLTLWVAIG